MVFFKEFIEEYKNIIIRYEGIELALVLSLIITIVMITMYLSYKLHIVLHELGHLFFGKITGCELLAFRVGQVIVTKNEIGNLVIKKQKVRGSGGQCLLGRSPKDNYILVTMGGIIFNLAFSFICFVLTFNIGVLHRAMAFNFIFVGIVIAIVNGFPIKKLEIMNDGRCLTLMHNDLEAQKCYFIQSESCKLLFSYSYKEIDYKLFEIYKNADLANDLIGYVQLMKYYYFLDKGTYNDALWCLSEFYPFEYRLSKMMKEELLLEKLFMELVTTNKREVIEKQMSNPILIKKLNNHMDLNVLRVNIAYEIKYKNDIKKAKEYYEKAKEILEDYPIPGEAKFHKEIINRLFYIER